MSRFDAIVIGGGINGLVAAAVLGRRGRSVCLLERLDRLGGMAGAEGAYPRMAHLLYNLGPLVRQDIGLGARDWPFRTVALPTVALNPGGAHVRIDGAEARFVDGRPHPDAAAYRALVTRLGGYGALLRRLAEAPPPGGDAAWTDPAALKQMLRLGGFGRALRQMPPLLRSYLAMGGWVSDHAVVDRDLGTLHVCTGVEIAAIPPSRARLLRADAR
jgi:phytoene dehydrogenase-like protein